MTWMDDLATGYSRVLDLAGSLLPRRNVLRFGSGFVVTDDSATKETVVTNTASASVSATTAGTVPASGTTNGKVFGVFSGSPQWGDIALPVVVAEATAGLAPAFGAGAAGKVLQVGAGGAEWGALPLATQDTAGTVPRFNVSHGATCHLCLNDGFMFWGELVDIHLLAPRQVVATGFSVDDAQDGCYVQTSVATAGELLFPLALKVGVTIYRVRAVVKASTHTALPATMPTIVLQRKAIALGAAEGSWADVYATNGIDGSATFTAYGLVHEMTFTEDWVNTVEDGYLYRIKITGETGANSLVGFKLLDLKVRAG